MKISCNTFEAFVVTLSRNCHSFGGLNCFHTQIQSILGQVHNPCDSCSMFRGEFGTQLRTRTPNSFLLHGCTQWRGSTSTTLHPNSRDNERTCLRSGRTPRPFSPHSSVLPRSTPFHSMSSSSPINIVSTSYSFNSCFVSNISSARNLVRRKSSTCTQRRISLVSVVSSGDDPAKSSGRREPHTWLVQACRRIDQMLPRGLQVATPRTTTSLRRHTERLS